MTPLASYDGPLGDHAGRLARRRIAVAQGVDGQPFLIRGDSVIVDVGDDDAERVRELVHRRSLEILGDPEIVGPSRLLGARIAPDRRPTTDGRWTTGIVNELLDDLGSRGLTVRPNHVYTPDGVDELVRGRAGTPRPVVDEGLTRLPSSVQFGTAPSAWPTVGGFQRRPHVIVLDTGLRTTGGRPEHPALSSCLVEAPWLQRESTRFNDEDEPDDDDGGMLDRQAGHGTFISGILRRECPAAVIHHSGVLSSYGDGDDASVAAAIDRALRRARRGGYAIDVVVASFGAYGDDVPPMAAALRRLLDRSVIVAAAGNDATTRPFFPAALDGVIAVGALGPEGRAPFSNWGPWVDACAPGVDVTSTFFTNFTDDDGDRRRTFSGWATWSGTSFAAPVVAGAIARRIARTGRSAHESWRAIAGDPSALRLPDLGVVVGAA